MTHNRWSDSVTLEFVKIYLKHICLWDPADPAYKIQALRDAAYNEVANEFEQVFGKKLTMYEVRTKIKALRTTYKQQVNRIMSSASEPGQVFEPTVVWFKEMDNCLMHIGKRGTTKLQHKCNEQNDIWPALPKQETTSEPYTSMWENDAADSDTGYVEAEHDNIVSSPDPLIPSYTQHTVTDHSLRKESETKVSKESDGKIKKKRIKHKREISPPTDSIKLEPPLKKSIEDEFDIYGRYIAAQLRSMDLRAALHVQMGIQTLISDARLKGNNAIK